VNAGNNNDLSPIGERRLKFVYTYHNEHEIIPRGSQKLSKNGRLFDYYRLNQKVDELACGKQGTSIPLWLRNEAGAESKCEVSETDQELKTCKGQRRNNFCCTFMLLLQLYELS
jgi:hypothetical protein